MVCGAKFSTQFEDEMFGHFMGTGANCDCGGEESNENESPQDASARVVWNLVRLFCGSSVNVFGLDVSSRPSKADFIHFF